MDSILEMELELIRLLEKLKERCKENEESNFEDKKKITKQGWCCT
ncbi:hypothetical protein AB2T63_12215 [Clostridium butyricum]|nr:hypothetical protein [Clostridium butyricum]